MTAKVGLVPFREHQADIIKIREPECSLLTRMGEPRSWIKQAGKRGPTFTLFAEGRGIIGIGGLILLWPGVAEAWAAISDLVEIFPKESYKAVKDILNQLEKSMKVHRIQTVVIEDFPAGRKFAEHLGFENEGRLRNYGPDGENFTMYARLKK